MSALVSLVPVSLLVFLLTRICNENLKSNTLQKKKKKKKKNHYAMVYPAFCFVCLGQYLSNDTSTSICCTEKKVLRSMTFSRFDEHSKPKKMIIINLHQLSHIILQFLCTHSKTVYYLLFLMRSGVSDIHQYNTRSAASQS